MPDANEETRLVAVIVPAHNEAVDLPSKLARIPRQQRPDLKVIVVDDSSADGTVAVAHGDGADVVVSHPQNRGLGAVLRTGLPAANELDAWAAVYVDADGEYPTEHIPDLVAAIEAGEADYVLGSHYLNKRPDQRLATVRYIGISQQDVAEGKDPGTHQAKALAFYQPTQPEVAQADPALDEINMAYVTADQSDITVASRDEALAALNNVASALLLTDDDLITSYW